MLSLETLRGRNVIGVSLRYFPIIVIKYKYWLLYLWWQQIRQRFYGARADKLRYRCVLADRPCRGDTIQIGTDWRIAIILLVICMRA